MDEFGSARAAFGVFDSDGSNSLSSQALGKSWGWSWLGMIWHGSGMILDEKMYEAIMRNSWMLMKLGEENSQ